MQQLKQLEISAEIAPWLSIWVRPRDTMRWILDTDPQYGVRVLAIIYGIASLLSIDFGSPPAGSSFLGGSWLLALAVGPIYGLAACYIAGAAMRWSGGRFGGRAKSQEVRAAFAWSSILAVAGIVFQPLLTVAVEATWSLATPGAKQFLAPARGYANDGIFVLSLVLTAWYLLVWLKCLGEAHSFSVWRALAATLVVAVILIVPLFCGSFGLMWYLFSSF